MHTSEVTIFATVAQEIPLDLLIWKSAGYMTAIPQHYIYLHTLKAAA